MSYYLACADTDTADGFDLNLGAWAEVRSLARRHGWEPLGTVTPTEKDADGLSIPPDSEAGAREMDYTTNGAQRVLARDAAALADALERALKTGDPSKEEELEWVADFLPAFIAFCRKGGFWIC